MDDGEGLRAGDVYLNAIVYAIPVEIAIEHLEIVFFGFRLRLGFGLGICLRFGDVRRAGRIRTVPCRGFVGAAGQRGREQEHRTQKQTQKTQGNIVVRKFHKAFLLA